MKAFIIITATLGIFILTVSLSLCALSVVLDDTKIGQAISDYIYSKIVKEKQDYQEQVDEVLGKDIFDDFIAKVGKKDD